MTVILIQITFSVFKANTPKLLNIHHHNSKSKITADAAKITDPLYAKRNCVPLCNAAEMTAGGIGGVILNAPCHVSS